MRLPFRRLQNGRKRNTFDDEVVAVVAWLFRSLRLDVIVEPTSLFGDNLGDVSNQRPDIHIRNPRKSRQVIIDVALTGVDGQSRTT